MLSVFLLILLFLCSRSLNVPCSGPVTYDTSEFTIRGPCPNDFLIVPVNDTVQYRCDYEERASGVYLPYWHITGLSGSPFRSDEQNDHQIAVELYITSSTEGYTTLNITVLQQYLNKSLSVQCGLCSFSKCRNEPLSENVTSQPVKLVAFSFPSSLCSTIVSNFVSLFWSPPSVSTDYTDPVDFQYEIFLTNMDTSQVYQFTTNDTHLNISQLLLPDDHDICSTYSWSVSAIVEERNIIVQSSNDTITIPSGPRIVSESIRTNISECKESVVISIELRVKSCSNLLYSNVTFEDSAGLTIVESDSTMKHLSGNMFVVKSKFIHPDLDQVFNGTITIKVGNIFESQNESYRIVEDIIDTYNMCNEDVTPSTTTIVISSNTVLNSAISVSSIHYSTLSVTISPVSVNPPPASSNGRVQHYHIYIPVGIAVFVLLVAVIIVLCIIIGLKLHKRKVVLIVTPTNENKPKFEPTANGRHMNCSFKYQNVDSLAETPVSSTSMDIDGSQPPKEEVEDCPSYATPCEIKETLSRRSSEARFSCISRPTSYAPSQLAATEITGSTQGYTEPLPSVSRVEEALYAPVSRTTTPTHLQVVDTPGYSEVPCMKKSKSKRRIGSTPRTSVSSMPVTPAHDISEIPKLPFQTLRDINETNGYCTASNAIYEEVNKENLNFEEDSTPQAYVGIDEIKSRKRARSKVNSNSSSPATDSTIIKDTRYVELDIPPPTSPPPPVPGTTTTYSTIVQLDHESALLPAYIDVKKIKERKKAGIKATLDSSSPATNSQNKMLIELQELPPPTPTHDLSTPPPDTPPPIPPRPSSALHSPSSRTPLNVMVNNSRFS